MSGDTPRLPLRVFIAWAGKRHLFFYFALYNNLMRLDARLYIYIFRLI